MIYALYAVLGIIALFLAVVIIRTLSFKPLPAPKLHEDEVSFDKDKAICSLQTLLRYKTVSYRNKSLENDGEFEGLVSKLPELFPHVFEKCTFIRFPDRGLLLKWEGKIHENASVMMSHYDVVPTDDEKWDKPPFDAILEDGVLWGRGALDTKVTFNAILTAADKLISEGFVPERDVYLAFSGCEETNGLGAVHIVDYFHDNGISIGLVSDEGGAVVENMFPGVKAPCGLIGIAEKGMMDVQYRVTTSGGHASAPAPHTPVGILSEACCKVENHPFKSKMTAPVDKMFDTLGRHSTFLYRMIFSNMWCFGWLLDLIAKKSGGEMNALMRTTVAFTQMQGSDASNVVPTDAKMVSNIRINPHDTMESVEAYLKKTVNSDKVEIKVLHGIQPSRISKTDCEEYRRIESAVASTWKGALVSPYLMVQCSDSRHYGKISDRVYRFSAMALTSEERRSIHGNNEKITVDNILKSVEFYIRLLKNS